MPARQPRVDPERAAQPSGAAACLEPGSASDRLGGPNQHAAWQAFAINSHVQAVVHAVDEVDVERSGRSPERLVAASASAEGVRRRVLESEIGLRLDDARELNAPAAAAHEDLAQQKASRPNRRRAEAAQQARALGSPGGRKQVVQPK